MWNHFGEGETPEVAVINHHIHELIKGGISLEFKTSADWLINCETGL